jgi:hypothetical protein
MAKKRVPLYDRLPEIYRIEDEEQKPSGQLKNYLELVETAFSHIHKNIESLYNDLFIETCDDWVIPYIGDLLGTSHLSGSPWTLRADVADTIPLRRRKGTLASIEQLTYNLTQWGVHCVELRENLVWFHHLNHQRPDEGGDPPYGLPAVTRFTPIRGGTVTLRDPAMLSLLSTPFDPFAHIADVKPPASEDIRYNLPNLAIFLWRLEGYQVPVSKPTCRGINVIAGAKGDEATHVVRFDVHPMGEPVVLFNKYQFEPDLDPPVVTQIDGTPGPVPMARLTEESEAGRPEAYVSIDTYDPSDPKKTAGETATVGLQLHLPEPEFLGQTWPDRDPKVWTIRGANLCGWEEGLPSPVNDREVMIDPRIGRILIGIGKDGDPPSQSLADAEALEANTLLTYTYGAVGPVGAHPISRQHVENVASVDYHSDPDALRLALDNIDSATSAVVIEITDSMTHELDLASVIGTVVEDGGPNLQLANSLTLRAADMQRPVIELQNPLRFRPKYPANASGLNVRLEGLYLTRGSGFPAGAPLIARAALNRLEIVNCTLDPGGFRKLDGNRADIQTSMELKKVSGLSGFDQTPEISLLRTVSGPLLIDEDYLLSLSDSIIDAGKGVNDDSTDSFAITSASDPVSGWGPSTQVNGITVFGRMRAMDICGRGGIWVHALEVMNNQVGCIRYSYLPRKTDQLPQHVGCVFGTEAELGFVSEVFGEPAYGQLSNNCDARIREQGPARSELDISIEEFLAERDLNMIYTVEDGKVYKLGDAMGAYGFLMEAHKWRNIQIRYREFMPVGVRPLLIPVT